jgi:hypothetical protein
MVSLSPEVTCGSSLHNLGCRVCSNYACSVKYESAQIVKLKVTDSSQVPKCSGQDCSSSSRTSLSPCQGTAAPNSHATRGTPYEIFGAHKATQHDMARLKEI